MKKLRPIHMLILSCENNECINNRGTRTCKKIGQHQTRTCGAYAQTSPYILDPTIKLKPRRIL